MSANDWNWWLAIVGTVASIAGVVFSILAWVQAGRAKRAAQEAADAAHTRNFVHSLSEWTNHARKLITSVRDMHLEEARWIAEELVSGLSYAKGQQKHRVQGNTGIDKIIRELDFISGYLESEEAFLATQDALIQNCRTILKNLQELSGTLDAKLEEI